MIEVEIYEGINGDPLKRVYFRNTKGWIIRESFYNPSNQPIIEEMVEFDDKNKISRQVLFLTTEYKTIAYRKLYQAGETKRSDKRLGSTDYKLIDGEFKKISWIIYEPSSKEKPFSRSIHYNQNDEMLYYCISDDTTFTTTYFTPDDQIIADFYEFHQKHIALVETYDSIKSDLLQQARNKYNTP